MATDGACCCDDCRSILPICSARLGRSLGRGLPAAACSATSSRCPHTGLRLRALRLLPLLPPPTGVAVTSPAAASSCPSSFPASAAFVSGMLCTLPGPATRYCCCCAGHAPIRAETPKPEGGWSLWLSLPPTVLARGALSPWTLLLQGKPAAPDSNHFLTCFCNTSTELQQYSREPT